MNQTNLQMSYDERDHPQIVDRYDVTHCDLETKSILKPAKVRAPLQEVDLGLDNHIDFDVVRKRRVSFAGVYKIKEFNSKAESLIICSTPAYEETFSTSSDSSAHTSSVTVKEEKNGLDDCTFLNDTMDLTDIQSDTDGNNLMDIASQYKPHFQPQGKEYPTNCENTDPNSKKAPEFPKGFVGNIFGIGSDIQPTSHAPSSFLDPVKVLIKEFLEDTNNDIVDMSMVGDCTNLHLKDSNGRKNIDSGIARNSFFSEDKYSLPDLKSGPQNPDIFPSVQALSPTTENVNEPSNIMDNSAMEITEQIPVKHAQWPCRIPAFPEFHSNMDFTEAVSNNKPFPASQSSNDVIIKTPTTTPGSSTNWNTTAVLKIDTELKLVQSNNNGMNPNVPTTLVDRDFNTSQGDLSQMDITETISEQLRFPDSEEICKTGKKNIPFQPFNMNFEVNKSQMEFTEAISNNLQQSLDSRVDTSINLIKMNKSHMEFTEAINKIELPSAPQANNYNIQSNIQVHSNMFASGNNSNTFEVNKSQMEFTEVISHNIKLSASLPTNSTGIKENIQFQPLNSDLNTSDINRSGMDFTEALCDNVNILHPGRASNAKQNNLPFNPFGKPSDLCVNLFDGNNSQMELTEAIIDKKRLPDPTLMNKLEVENNATTNVFRAASANLNLFEANKSQMDFTEAINDQLKLLDPKLFNSIDPQNNKLLNFFGPTTISNTNSFNVNKSQMEFTEAICHNVKERNPTQTITSEIKNNIPCIAFGSDHANINTFDMNKSQMAFTEAVSNKENLPYSVSAINPIIKTNTQFKISNLVDSNIKPFEVNKSQMDSTEAICNQVKEPEPPKAINPEIKDSISVNTSKNEVDKSLMDFTEAICNTVKKEPEPRKAIDTEIKDIVSVNTNENEVDKSLMDFTEAICNRVKEPEPPKAIDTEIKDIVSVNTNENEVHKSLMDFTEAICNRVKEPEPPKAIDTEIKDIVSVNTNENEVDKSLMDFTEAICNRVKEPEPPKAIDTEIKDIVSVNTNENEVHKSLMDFTEAICNRVKEPEPPKAIDTEIKDIVSVNTNKNEVNKSPIGFTGAICQKVKKPDPTSVINSERKNCTLSNVFSLASANMNTSDDNRPGMEFTDVVSNDAKLLVPINSDLKNNLSSAVHINSNTVENSFDRQFCTQQRFSQQISFSHLEARKMERLIPSTSYVLDVSPVMDVTDLKPQVLHPCSKAQLLAADPMKILSCNVKDMNTSQVSQEECAMATERIDKLNVNNFKTSQIKQCKVLTPWLLNEGSIQKGPNSDSLYKSQPQRCTMVDMCSDAKLVNVNLTENIPIKHNGKVTSEGMHLNISGNSEEQIPGDKGYLSSERENKYVKEDGSSKDSFKNENSAMCKDPCIDEIPTFEREQCKNWQEPMDCDQEIPSNKIISNISSNKVMDSIEINSELAGRNLVHSYRLLSSSSFSTNNQLKQEFSTSAQTIVRENDVCINEPRRKTMSHQSSLVDASQDRNILSQHKGVSGADLCRTRKWEKKGEEEWNMVKKNRSFMAGIGFTFVSPTLWKYSFPWPLDLIVRTPTGYLDFSTKKNYIKLVKRSHKSDIVGELADRCMRKSLSLILSESWLNSDCSFLKDLELALNIVKEEYYYLETLIAALRRLYSYFPFKIDDFRILMKIVNIKRKHIINIQINLANYKKLSGSCVKVTNVMGGVSEEGVQKLFDDQVPNEDRLVNFVKAVNHLLASS